MEIIKEKYTSGENALIIENYPYGFRLKTKIRYWVESNKKGDRFCSQTLNPKTNQWNKAKFSIYYTIAVLCKDEKGYITYKCLYPTTSREDILRFEEFIKDYDLNEFQKEQLKRLKALSKAMESVSFECVNVTNQTDEERAKGEEEQKKATDNLNKLVGYYYKTGEF